MWKLHANIVNFKLHIKGNNFNYFNVTVTSQPYNIDT